MPLISLLALLTHLAMPNVPARAPALSGYKTLWQQTYQLATDKATGRVWATVPKDAKSNANCLLEIDPATGAIVRNINLGVNNIGEGSDPKALAISDDGTALYVGLNGIPSIRRIDPISGAMVKEYAQPNDRRVTSIQVQPGHSCTIAIMRNNANDSGSEGPIVLVDGAGLPVTVKMFYEGNQVCFSGENTVVSTSSVNNPPEICVSTIGASGVTLKLHKRFESIGDIRGFSIFNAKLYVATGIVIDVQALTIAGQFNLRGGFGLGCTVDLAANRAFFVEGRLGIQDPTVDIEGFDLKSFASKVKMSIPNVVVRDVFVQAPESWPNVVRCGATGLAFRSPRAVYFIDQAPGL